MSACNFRSPSLGLNEEKILTNVEEGGKIRKENGEREEERKKEKKKKKKKRKKERKEEAKI